MASESRLPLLIFGTLVALILIPFLLSQFLEKRRPIMVEARIITAVTSDPVFRHGRRNIPPGEGIEIALALKLQQSGKENQWLAPVTHLEIDGRTVEHINSDKWPENDRSLRVFWFTVENPNVGGKLSLDDASQKLRYQTFFAPEMGRGLRAAHVPEAHNDDHLGLTDSGAGPTIPAGTLRLYARVEVVQEENDIRALQHLTTMGVEHIFDSDFPTVARSADFGEGLNPVVGELFLLPGFEPQGESFEEREHVSIPATGKSFRELVEQRLVVSSRTLAAVAKTGTPDFNEALLQPLASITISIDRIHHRGRLLLWGSDVFPGDLIVDRTHWIILLKDQGNGFLDPADTVLHCWGRPPVLTTVSSAVRENVSVLELFRYEP